MCFICWSVIVNIFYLSNDPVEAARWHLDRHVVKMILEYAQLLSTAHRILDNSQDPILYRITHKNHPSAVWVRKSVHNYNWLYELFIALCDEYTRRYGKIHLTDTKLRDVLVVPPKNISTDPFVQPPQAMPNEYKDVDSIVAYRQYYINAKNKFATWKIPEHKPSWFITQVSLNY